MTRPAAGRELWLRAVTWCPGAGPGPSQQACSPRVGSGSVDQGQGLLPFTTGWGAGPWVAAPWVMGRLAPHTRLSTH